MRHISLRLKVFGTDLKDSQQFMLKVPYFVDEQAHANAHEVSNFVALLKKQFPGNEFKVVPADRNRYNVFPQPLANA